MTAAQLTLGLAPGQWDNLVTPPADVPDDDDTILYAIQHGVCANCRTPGATPWPGEEIPYCDTCKRKQEAQWAHLN